MLTAIGMQTLSEVNLGPSNVKLLSFEIFLFHFMVRVAFFEKSELYRRNASGTCKMCLEKTLSKKPFPNDKHTI